MRVRGKEDKECWRKYFGKNVIKLKRRMEEIVNNRKIRNKTMATHLNKEKSRKKKKKCKKRWHREKKEGKKRRILTQLEKSEKNTRKQNILTTMR